MYGHGIAREMEEWHADHNGRANDPAWASFLDDFRAQLDVKQLELLQEHSNNGRFGMSKAGGCTRAAQLKALGYEPEPFSGSTRMTFLIGHMVECVVVSTLRACGYEIDGTQEPVTIDPFMHSYSDGLMKGGTGRFAREIGEHTILSVKSAGYKKSGRTRKRDGSYSYVRRGFPELPFEGMRRAQPTHWVQAQAEMHGYHLAGRPFTQCLYTVCSKDIIKAMEDDPYLGDGDGKGNGSLTFYAEMIQYDPGFCERQLMPVWQRAWDEVEAGKAGGGYFIAKENDGFARLRSGDEDWKFNAGATGTYNPCNYCDLLSACRSHLAHNFHKP